MCTLANNEDPDEMGAFHQSPHCLITQNLSSESEIQFHFIGLVKQIFSKKLPLYSYPSVSTYVLGAQKNCLVETVLLSTHKICFGREIIYSYALLSGGLYLQI